MAKKGHRFGKQINVDGNIDENYVTFNVLSLCFYFCVNLNSNTSTVNIFPVAIHPVVLICTQTVHMIIFICLFSKFACSLVFDITEKYSLNLIYKNRKSKKNTQKTKRFYTACLLLLSSILTWSLGMIKRCILFLFLFMFVHVVVLFWRFTQKNHLEFFFTRNLSIFRIKRSEVNLVRFVRPVNLWFNFRDFSRFEQSFSRCLPNLE